MDTILPRVSYTRTIRVFFVSTFARQWSTHYHGSVGHYLSFRHPENRETQAEHYANRIYRKHRISFLRQRRNRTVLLPRQFIHIMMYVMKNFNGQCDYLNRRFVNVDSVSVSDRYRKYSILPSPLPLRRLRGESKSRFRDMLICYQTAKEKRNDEKRVTTTRGLISFHRYRTRVWIRVDSLSDRRWVIERNDRCDWKVRSSDNAEATFLVKRYPPRSWSAPSSFRLYYVRPCSRVSLRRYRIPIT